MPRSMTINQLPGFIKGLAGEMDAAARIAGDEALKSIRAWTIAYVRERKALRMENAPVRKRINQSMKSIRPRKGTAFPDMRWELRVHPMLMPMAAYPHSPVPGIGGGVLVEINTGKPVLVRHAFLAKMRSGHEGIFVREPGAVHVPSRNKWGQTQLPIRELFTSSIADILNDALVKPTLQQHGQGVYAETFARVMSNGVAKKLAAKWAARRR